MEPRISQQGAAAHGRRVFRKHQEVLRAKAEVFLRAFVYTSLPKKDREERILNGL